MSVLGDNSSEVKRLAFDTNLIEISADIVSAYVSKNALSAADLPKLLRDVHGVLKNLGTDVEVEESVELHPAVSPKKSVTPDYVICLEDGKKFKSLKRHLHTHHGLSPDEYRQKWHLPADYPMVAPNYSATRSRLAMDNGLGRNSPEEAPTKPTRAKASA
jgi:predicted transcriptional regulator